MRHAVSVIMNELLFWLLYVRMRLVKKNKRSSTGVLLVRFSHIGDFVLWLDAAKEFRNIYPDEKITFLCSRYKDVRLLAEKTGYFDEVIVLQSRGPGRMLSIFKCFRMTCRTVIYADPSRSVLSDIFIMAVNAQERIAQKTDLTRMTKWQARRSDRVYDKIIPCGGIRTMELIRNAQFIRGLSGKNSFRAALPQIPPLLSQKEVQNYLKENLIKKPYFVLCPGGEVKQKYWDSEKFAAVLNAVFIRAPALQCAVIGSAGEETQLDQILRDIKEKTRVTSLIGKTDLLEYIEVIRHADWLLANDTSAAHIAAATGTRAAVIAESWDWGRFYPYRVEKRVRAGGSLPVSIHAQMPCAGCGRYGVRPRHMKCLEQGRVRCIHQIQAGQVISVIENILQQSGPLAEPETDSRKRAGRNKQERITTNEQQADRQGKIYRA